MVVGGDSDMCVAKPYSVMFGAWEGHKKRDYPQRHQQNSNQH